MKNISYFALILCCASSAQAQVCNLNAAQTVPDGRYQLVADSGGNEVLDKQTNLIWQRCSLGQTWSGITCTGTSSTHTWTDALAKAKSMGNGYRLPSIKELQSLVERSCFDAAINKVFFPATPSSWYWSASPNAYPDAYGISGVWYVDFYYGAFFSGAKSHSGRVRAVRTAP